MMTMATIIIFKEGDNSGEKETMEKWTTTHVVFCAITKQAFKKQLVGPTGKTYLL